MTDGDISVVDTDPVWSTLKLVSVVGCGLIVVGFAVGLDLVD
jgi:hypothetical protein